jgi:CubicO group peptidase (beta-lactamase class C family)
MGYSYLWWIPTDGRTGSEWAGSFMADGNYGQYILCLPALDMTVIHRRAVPDEFAIARNLGNTEVNPPGVGNEAFLKTADLILAARQ